MQTFIRSLILGSLVFGPCIAQTFTLSGAVVDSQKNALSGITVIYNSIPVAPVSAANAPARLMPTVSGRATSSANGNFVIGGLPSGVYNICALAAVAGQISSCESGARPTIVVVGSASPGAITLVMGAGVAITISVSDPNGLLRSGLPLAIGARTDDGTYKFARPQNQSAQAATYSLTVPFNHVSQLVVDTTASVTDSLGNAVAVKQPGIVLPSTPGASLTVLLVLH